MQFWSAFRLRQGIGGGIMAIPVLTGPVMLSQLGANASAQLVNTGTSILASLNYFRDELVNIPIAVTTGITASLVTPFGVKLVSLSVIPLRHISSPTGAFDWPLLRRSS